MFSLLFYALVRDVPSPHLLPSCGLIYQEGQLSYASTRGDGITGENVTATVLSCGFAQEKLLMGLKTGDGTREVQVPREIEIRGEV